jgi:hypothetical protein
VERAAVKVLISHECDGLDAQDLNAQGPSFFVDIRGACVVDGASLQELASGLKWHPVPGANRYSLRLFERRDDSGESLVPLQDVELAEPQWIMPAQTARERHGAAQRVATVQAICDGLPGRPIALPLQGR